jgi:hypothetical protein
MPDAQHPPRSQPSGRRAPQFRLRTLLAIVFLAGLAFAWHRQARVQSESVNVLRDSNRSASVYFAHQLDAQGRLLRTAPPPGPSWLRHWTGDDYFARATRVDLQYATDADLAHVGRLTLLEALTLVRAVDVTDRGLAHLRGLKKLRVLKLFDADMLTDHALLELAQIRSLRELTLGPMPRHVTPAAVARLRKALPRCRVNVTNVEGDERQLLSAGGVI